MIKISITVYVLLIINLCFAQNNDTLIKRRVFPLLHGLVEQAEKNGQELPLPFGVSVSTYFQEQNMYITNVKIGDLIINEEGKFIDISGSQISNSTYTSQLRADMWLFPFMNIYGAIGRVTTFNNIELLVNLNIPPIPGITPGDVKTIERGEIAKINGTVLGLGTVLGFGYKKFFVNVNLSYAKTYLSKLKSSQSAIVVLPMLGYTTKFCNVFIAAMYQNKGQDNKGSFVSSNGTKTDYEIKFRAQEWNFNFGINKNVKHWSFNIMAGLGPRVNGLLEIGYRF